MGSLVFCPAGRRGSSRWFFGLEPFLVARSRALWGLEESLERKEKSSLSVLAGDSDARAGRPSSILGIRTESTFIVLEFCADGDCTNLCPEPLDIESQASPAAFEDACGGLKPRPPEGLGDFEGFFPSFVRKVVSIRLFFSGLGVLEVCFGGIGSVGGGYGNGGLDVGIWEVLCDLIAANSELFFGVRAGRWGSGGGCGRDRSG